MAFAQPRPHVVQPPDNRAKLIALTKGQVALVDAIRYDWAMQWNWYAEYSRSAKAYYAVRRGREGEPKTVYLHRQIMGEPAGEVDHKNRTPLDCRTANLRACSHAQNHANRGLASNNTTGYRGVAWMRTRNKWRARLKVNQTELHLGCFDNKDDAIRARLTAERQHFGEFAYSASRTCEGGVE